MDLTVYIIPSFDDHHAPERALKSFGDITDYHVLNTRDLTVIEPKTAWYGYLFSNEWIEDRLAAALPVFMERPFDYLVLYKAVKDEENITHFFTAPRLFRSHVRIAEGQLIPKDHEQLSCEKVLNGWILEDGKC